MFEDLRQATIAVASKVFETMFFISLDEQGGGEEAFTAPKVLRGEIGFKGTDSGALILVLPYEFAKNMTTNFLGLEEEEATEGQVTDMVGELCNMICGNLFSEFDKKNPCTLTLPKTEILDSQSMGEFQGAQVVVPFEADEAWVTLALKLEPPFRSGN